MLLPLPEEEPLVPSPEELPLLGSELLSFGLLSTGSELLPEVLPPGVYRLPPVAEPALRP